MIDPTVGQIFETFTESEKEALYTIANAVIGEVYCNKRKVKDSARLLKSLPETKKKVAYFLVGKCLENVKECEEK